MIIDPQNTGLATEANAHMQRISDLVCLMNHNSATEQRAQYERGLAPLTMYLFGYASRGNIEIEYHGSQFAILDRGVTAYEPDKAIRLSASVIIQQMLPVVEEKFARYVGNDPRNQLEHTPTLAIGHVRRLAGALDLVEEAIGERQAWLAETIGNILHEAQKNPHFGEALQAKGHVAGSVRDRLHLIFGADEEASPTKRARRPGEVAALKARPLVHT